MDNVFCFSKSHKNGLSARRKTHRS